MSNTVPSTGDAKETKRALMMCGVSSFSFHLAGSQGPSLPTSGPWPLWPPCHILLSREALRETADLD